MRPSNPWKFNIIKEPIIIPDAEGVVREIHDHLKEDFESRIRGQQFSLALQQQIDHIVGQHIRYFKQKDMLQDLQSTWKIEHDKGTGTLTIAVVPISYSTGMREIGPAFYITTVFVM